INLVSQNVANADSIGYTRKTLSPVQTLNGASSAGVKAGAVQRILDTLVQKQLRNETSGAAYTKTRAEFATALDRLFGAPGASSSLDGAMNAFNESLSMLANDPADFAARAAVLDAAQTLAARIGSAAQGVQQLRTQAEGRIDAAVTRANELLSGIAETNRKITAESFRAARPRWRTSATA
uniref:FlgK family flagellar hook-associated protein n=1 Tax=Pantanalinema rosaneae TaxID=1620701 RepID=UPI003D6EA27E